MLRRKDGYDGTGDPNEASWSYPCQALGLLCDMRLHRGQRQLALRSVVEVHNDTSVPLELRLSRDAHMDSLKSVSSTGAAKLSPARQAASGRLAASSKFAPTKGGDRDDGDGVLVIPPGESRPLPLVLTLRGSDAACWELKVRPQPAPSDPSRVSAVVSSSEVEYEYASPLPFDSDAKAVALLACTPDPSNAPAGSPAALGIAGGGGGGAAWMCCVQLHHASLNQSRKTTSAAARRRHKDLRKLDLPPSETVLHTWPCLLASAVPVPAVGHLYLTPNFVCFVSTMGGAVETVPWAQVEQLHTTGVVSSNIELLLTSGRRVAFGGFRQRRLRLHASVPPASSRGTMRGAAPCCGRRVASCSARRSR